MKIVRDEFSGMTAFDSKNNRGGIMSLILYTKDGRTFTCENPEEASRVHNQIPLLRRQEVAHIELAEDLWKKGELPLQEKERLGRYWKRKEGK